MTVKLRIQAHSTAFLRAMPLLVVLFTVTFEVKADATVYRCGSAGSQWYSQIPCSEDSEPMVIKDQHKLSEPDGLQNPVKGGNEEPEEQEPAAQAPVNNAEAFIQQLEKQRSEQLAELDRNIARLEQQASDEAGAEAGDPSADEAAALIAGMRNTRESIVSEYDAMISAARQRSENL